MARKKKIVVETLADLIAKHRVEEAGFATIQGYEDIEPEELIVMENKDESTSNQG